MLFFLIFFTEKTYNQQKKDNLLIIKLKKIQYYNIFVFSIQVNLKKVKQFMKEFLS